MCPIPDSHGSQKDRLANSNFFAVSSSLDSYSLCSYLRIATGVCGFLRWMKPLGKGFLSEARAPIGHPRPLLGTSIFKINTAVSRISSAGEAESAAAMFGVVSVSAPMLALCCYGLTSFTQISTGRCTNRTGRRHEIGGLAI